MSNFDEHYFMHRFPNIYKKFHSLGYDVPTQRVPISPAFHYAIGGIKTDKNGLVEGIKNLYAVGEVASTKVHGANRLASNSLLEALVFSKNAALSILKDNSKKEFLKFDVTNEVMSYKEDKEKKNLLRKIMWEKVGVIRTRSGLLEAKEQINALLQQKIGKLLKFRLLSAREIVTSAIKREKSIGVHYIKEELNDA
jgi:L-aspartate oxidase